MSARSPATAFGRNRSIVTSALNGTVSGVFTRREQFRYGLMRDTWIALRRFSAVNIDSIDLADMPELWPAVVTGYVDDPQRSLIAALARILCARTFFEVGTSLGRTTWTVAHHNPDLQVFTLDMPLDRSPDSAALTLGDDDVTYFRPQRACGEAFRDTPEAARITQLWGDSARFDYRPYAGQVDLVYIDGAHSYEYVASDTRAALTMLAPGGTVIWDDYLTSPGVYRYLTEVAAEFSPPIFHVAGTRMAISSHRSLIQRRSPRYPFS